MMTISELKRRFENVIQIGTIGETKNQEGKALGRVILDDEGENKRVSRFLPVISLANSFAKVWFPLRIGEQVLVVSPFGNANSGFIIRSIFNKGCKEPALSSANTTVIEFEDGSVLHYDSKTKLLNFNCVGDINIQAKGNITFEAGGSILSKAGSDITNQASNALIQTAGGASTMESSGQMSMKASKINLN